MTRRALLYAFAVSGFFALSLIAWYRVDTRPPGWDETVHLNLSLDYKDRLWHGTPVTSPWASVYTPLYHYSLIPALSTGIPSQPRAVATHVAYALVLMMGLLMLARFMTAPPEDAAAAGLLMISMPIALFVERRALIDFPLLAWEIFGLALLWHTENFAHRGRTVAFGLWCGFGLLMKPHFGFSMIGPLIWTLWRGRQWKNAALAAGACALVAAHWYVRQGPQFLRNAVNIVGETGGAEGDPSATTLTGWLWYLRGLSQQLGPVLLGIVAFGGALLVVRRKALGARGLLLALAGSNYMLMTLMHNKDLRYAIPMAGALVAVAVFAIMDAVGSTLGRRIVLGLAALVFVWNTIYFDRPKAEHWPQDEIGTLLAARHDTTQPFLLASVLSNHIGLYGRALRWTMRAHGIPMSTSSVSDPSVNFTEFIVTKSGDLGPMADDLRRERAALDSWGRAFTQVYPEISRFPLPDGTEATVYQRNPSPNYALPITQAGVQRAMELALKPLIQGTFKVEITGKLADWKKGHFETIRIAGGPWTLRDLPIASADVVVREASINLYQLFDHGRPGLMGFHSLAPQATVRAAELQALLQKRAKGIDALTLRFEGGRAVSTASYKGIPLKVSLQLLVEGDRNLVAYLEHASVAHVPLPLWLLGSSRRQSVPLSPIPSFPGCLAIGKVTLSENSLQITP